MPQTTDETPAATAAGPRYATLKAAVVYALAALSLGYPALVGKFLVNPRSDQYIAGYAFREFAASTLRTTGHFPLWNPYLLGGMPYVAAMHGDIFYPTFLLRLVMPTDMAMTWGFIVHIFLAGLFTFLFLRAIGLGFFAALIGGLAYMLGGNVAGLASPGHDGKLFLSALLPIALLVVLRGVRDGRRWGFGALAFVVGLGVLTPHPQVFQYVLLASGAWGVFLAFGGLGDARLARPVALRRLGLAAAAVLVGFAIGAIQYLPVLQYVPWSPRGPGHSWEVATSFSLPPEEMVNFYIPQFTGMLDAYWGRNPIHLHSEYIGAAVLVLVLLAFSRSWEAPQRRLIWFWSGSLAIALLWAMGGYTPFFHVIYAIVPGTKFFRAPSTMLLVVSFCVATLAAFGAERAVRGNVSRKYLVGWAAFAGLAAALGIAGGLTNLAVGIAPAQSTELALANDGALRFGALRSALFVTFALTCLFLLATRRLSRAAAGSFLAVVVALDLWSIERSYWIFSPPASTLFASNEILEYVKKQPEPARVLPLATSRENVAFHDPYLVGDGLMVHRIRSPLGYHGNELGRYQRLGKADEQWASIANPNFWALENIQFILTENSDLNALGVQGAKRIMGPVKDPANTALYLYRLTEDNPAAWVTPVIVKAADDAVLQTVLDPRFDVRRAALFDTAAKVQGKEVQVLPERVEIRARTTRYDPGAIDVQLDQPAPKGAALVVSENYFPGWQATVDSKPATTGRADMTLVGVELPEGARNISLRFSSPPFETGKTVTLIALAIALVAWGGGALLDRVARG
jgi:hypothetical protein